MKAGGLPRHSGADLTFQLAAGELEQEDEQEPRGATVRKRSEQGTSKARLKGGWV